MATYNITDEALKKGTAAPADILNTPGLSTYKAPQPVTPTVATPTVPIPTTTPTPVISAKTLSGTPAPMKVTTKPPVNTAESVINQAGATAQQEQAKSAEQMAYEASKAEMGGLVEQIGGKTTESMRLAQEKGLNQLSSDVNANNIQILAIQDSVNKQRERLQGSGLTQEQLNQQMSAINNQAAQRINTLEIQNALKNNNITSLQNQINTSLALKYEPLETKLEIAKMNYQDNKDFFTKAEQRAYESKVREEERKIAKEKEDDQNKFSLLTTALNNGVQIPANLLSQINDPKTDSKKAVSLLAGAGISLENRLDRAYKQAQIAKMYQDIAESQNKIAPQNATVQDSSAQLNFLKDTVSKAKKLAGASGRSGARRFVEGALVGSTKYTQLDQYTNTLKTNMLTLATDPNIKKFFGPQMSNADVLLMTSAGTTLNPQNLNSKQMKEELKRIDGLFTRMQSSLPAGMEIQGGQVVNTEQPQTKVYNGQTYVKVEGGWKLQ